MHLCCRLSGSGSRPGGFCGTLYDGGHVLQQLRDKVFAVCISQAGAPSLQTYLCGKTQAVSGVVSFWNVITQDASPIVVHSFLLSCVWQLAGGTRCASILCSVGCSAAPQQNWLQSVSPSCKLSVSIMDMYCRGVERGGAAYSGSHSSQGAQGAGGNPSADHGHVRALGGRLLRRHV